MSYNNYVAGAYIKGVYTIQLGDCSVGYPHLHHDSPRNFDIDHQIRQCLNPTYH